MRPASQTSMGCSVKSSEYLLKSTRDNEEASFFLADHTIDSCYESGLLSCRLPHGCQSLVPILRTA